MRVAIRPTFPRKQRAFTLLELVIVIAILAIIGGAALVNYDGLDKRAALGQAAFNLSAIDKGIRLFHAISGDLPNNLDSLVLYDTTIPSPISLTAISATSGGFISILTPPLKGTDGYPASSDGILHFYSLSGETAAALQGAGLSTLRGIAIANDSGGNLTPANRAFDPAPTGVGASVNVATGLVVPIVKAKNLGASDSSVLQQITGLDINTTHLVVALGLGNNSSIVSDKTGVTTAAFSEAPFYGGLNGRRYGRFLLLYHLGSDLDSDDVIGSTEVFREAQFVAVIDAFGNWLDKAASDSVGTKS